MLLISVSQAATETDIPTLTDDEILYIERNKKKLKSKRKKRLSYYMKKIKKKTRGGAKSRRYKKKSSTSISTAGDSVAIRTEYEKIFESYCKLLGQPYIINTIFCFICNNYYYYGDTSRLPRCCKICHSDFYTNKGEIKGGVLARPDFVLDFNNLEARLQYANDCHRYPKGLENIRLYHDEYMKKVGMVRIDGGVHGTKTQMRKDYNQVQNFKNAGVKVFIVTNEDIDALIQDNGKALLDHCHMIGNCIIDELEYLKYCQTGDYVERTAKPLF